mmetsp:Transcript_29554/g.80854  ORF Transcript_29554/g.80854 Transcript_29554/m.80854 type:complete len:245 (+) Transcript_29554:64-798(+)
MCDPYLPLPGIEEPSPDEWADSITIDKLPALPKRSGGYWAEPWCGILAVLGISAMLISLTSSVMVAGQGPNFTLAALLVPAIWTWASIAVACTAYIVLGRAGEITRSASTCFPIPTEVARCLASSESLGTLKNIDGKDGCTYCVRCLVWRPAPDASGRPHHCNTCQRCVTGFDHHCGVFGRCIVSGNMFCFYTVNIMFLLGAGTSMAALCLTPAVAEAGVSSQAEVWVTTSMAPPTGTAMLWVG